MEEATSSEMEGRFGESGVCSPVASCEFDCRVELGIGHFEETIQRTIDSSEVISLSDVIHGFEPLASIL